MCECSCKYEPEVCVKFYILWCLAFGGGFTICGFTRGVNGFLKASDSSMHLVDGVCNIITGIAALTYFIAGILFLIGYKKGNKNYFRAGKILSYIFPILSFFLIFTLVVHICVILKVSEFVKEVWG
nr:uncharacterized protein LOC121502920 [Drosophila kikkawai]